MFCFASFIGTLNTAKKLFLAFTAGATALFGFPWHIWACSATGLIVGVIIGLATYYLDHNL